MDSTYQHSGEIKPSFLGRRNVALAAAFGLTLTACAGTNVTTASVTAVAADVTTLVADIQADTSGQPLTTAELATISAATTKLQTDVTDLNAGTAGVTVASVLGDVATGISDIGQFLPEIAALASFAATPNAAPVPPVQQKMRADYAKLQVDAAGK